MIFGHRCVIHDDELEIGVGAQCSDAVDHVDHERDVEAPDPTDGTSRRNDDRDLRPGRQAASDPVVAVPGIDDVTVDASPRQCVRDCSSTRVDSVGFGIESTGGGALDHSPVVEHLGMWATVRARSVVSEDQVVVLGAVETRSESTDLDGEITTERRDVRAVVLAQQPFRRPCRLREHVEEGSVDIDFVLVRVHVVDGAVQPDFVIDGCGSRPRAVGRRDRGEQRTRPWPWRGRQSEAREIPPFSSAPLYADPRIEHSESVECGERALVGRTVVDDAPFPFWVRLGEHRIDALEKGRPRWIEDRCQDAEHSPRHEDRFFSVERAVSAALSVLRLAR